MSDLIGPRFEPQTLPLQRRTRYSLDQRHFCDDVTSSSNVVQKFVFFILSDEMPWSKYGYVTTTSKDVNLDSQIL